MGPNADGTINPVIQEMLLQLGEWLDVNGEAIYESHKSELKGLPEGVKATERDGNAYLMFNKYPKEKIFIPLTYGSCYSKIKLLGSDAAVECTAVEGGIEMKAPALTVDEMPCRCVYTIKLIK